MMLEEWNREEVEYETLSSFLSSRDYMILCLPYIL
jgi:hypothetical protein